MTTEEEAAPELQAATTVKTMAMVEDESATSQTLKKVEQLVRELQDQFRDQALSASQNNDLIEAKKEIDVLMQDAVETHRRLEQVAKSSLELQRDLSQANDRSLVVNAEKQSNEMDKESLKIAAEAHLRQCRCRNAEGEPWPLWSTQARDLEEYGLGISLYFRWTVSLGLVMVFATVVTLPLVVLNWTGTGLTDVDVGAGEPGFFAVTSIGNFLSSDGSISLSRFEISAADVGFYIGVMDALAGLAVLALAVWFERVVLPAAVRKEAATTVTPEAYTIFVNNLPRRLAEDRHKDYEKLLEQHFERQLNAQILPQMQMQGWQVIAKDQQYLDEPPAARCCGSCFSSSVDSRGRRVGAISDVEGASCLVRWPDATGRLQAPQQVALDGGDGAKGLLQADLLHRLEEVGCQPTQETEGRKGVYRVSLIRDFHGKLHNMRRVVDRAKQIGEQEETSEKEAKELADAEEELKHLKLEEKDVLGAFVTFTYIKFKDFVSQEYRFSRLFLLGSWLQGADQRFEGRALKLQDAPLPSDIFWENFDCPKNARRLKTLVMCVAFLVVLLIMVLGLSLAKWGREQAQAQSPDCSIYANVTNATLAASLPTECYCAWIGAANVLQDEPAGILDTCQGYIQTLAMVNSMVIGAAIFSCVINLVSGYLIAMFAHFMQPPNWTALETKITEMTFLVQLLTLGIVVTLVNAEFGFAVGAEKGLFGLIGGGDYADVDRSWTAAVGVEILTLFLFSLSTEVVAAVLVLWFKLSCWCFAGKKKTWKEMKALYTPPDFELALNQASQLAAVCAALLYSSCLPILNLILAVRLFAMYWASKFQLLRGCSVPKRYSHVLALAATRWVQVAVFFHSAVAVWVYGDAQITGTTNFLFDPAEATNAVTEASKILGNQLAVLVKIVVEKALTPAALPNAILLTLLLTKWLLKLLSYLLGEAEWRQLVAALQKKLAKVCKCCAARSHRRSVFDRPFDKEPMQEMRRMKINPSYDLWCGSGFEFLAPGEAGERSIQALLQESKKRQEEEAQGLLAKSASHLGEGTPLKSQQFPPVQLVGHATADTE